MKIIYNVNVFLFILISVEPINLADFYSTLTTPSLHIIGEKDKLVNEDAGRYFASLNQYSKIIVYKDAFLRYIYICVCITNPFTNRQYLCLKLLIINDITRILHNM